MNLTAAFIFTIIAISLVLWTERPAVPTVVKYPPVEFHKARKMSILKNVMPQSKPLKIVIETIPQSQQRYKTVGDYWVEPDGTWHIVVSDTGDWREAFLIAMHELTEKALAVQRGIQDKDIDIFDMAWKEHDGITEPGDDKAAPYYHEHQFATGIERMLAAELSVDWNDYGAHLDKLY